MIEINPKFEIGEEVYTITQKKLTMLCPMCSASKVVTYNGVTVKCPNCCGTGEFETNKRVWDIVNEAQEIKTVKATITKYGSTVKYKLNPKTGYGSVLSRSEETLFKTKEDAQQECNKRNEIHMHIKVSDIKITTAFSNTIPSPKKIAQRVEEYKTEGKFNTDVVVRNGYLIDGYSAYLVCKMLGIETLKVTII